MAIVAGDLKNYGAASRPENDVDTSGGAIDVNSRPEGITQFTAGAVVAVISDGADTRTLTVTGRLASGLVDTEMITLTGAVEALGLKTFITVLKLVLSATDGSRTVSVKQGSGGTVRATILPNETTRYVLFINSQSETGAVTRYEKVFMKNTHGSITLTQTVMKLTADPNSKIEIGLATAKGDSVSVANRKTVPGGITFVDDNVDQSVPTNILAAAEVIGVWIKQSLGIGDAALNSSYTLQLRGTTIA